MPPTYNCCLQWPFSSHKNTGESTDYEVLERSYDKDRPVDLATKRDTKRERQANRFGRTCRICNSQENSRIWPSLMQTNWSANVQKQWFPVVHAVLFIFACVTHIDWRMTCKKTSAFPKITVVNALSSLCYCLLSPCFLVLSFQSCLLDEVVGVFCDVGSYDTGGISQQLCCPKIWGFQTFMK